MTEGILNDLQPCKKCGRTCNREHFAQQPTSNNRLITYLYCEDCNIGWEVLWTRDGNHWKFNFDIQYSSEDRRKLDHFLLNLRMANSVAA